MDQLAQSKINAYKKALETRKRKMTPYDILVKTINVEKHNEDLQVIDITFKNLNYQFGMSITMWDGQVGSLSIYKKENPTRVSTNVKSYEEILSQVRRMLKYFYIEEIIIRSEYYKNSRTIFKCDGKECPGYKEIMENPSSKVLQRNIRKRISLKKENAKKISELLGTSEGSKYKC